MRFQVLKSRRAVDRLMLNYSVSLLPNSPGSCVAVTGDLARVTDNLGTGREEVVFGYKQAFAGCTDQSNPDVTVPDLVLFANLSGAALLATSAYCALAIPAPPAIACSVFGLVGGVVVLETNAALAQILASKKLAAGELSEQDRENLRSALNNLQSLVLGPHLSFVGGLRSRVAGALLSLLLLNGEEMLKTTIELVDFIRSLSPPTTPSSLEVSPATGLSMTGNVGGPFTPPSQNYTLTNTGGTAISYNISKSQSWVSLSSTGGFLEPGLSTDVLVAINSNAVSLGAGSYSDTVIFTNTLNGNDNTSRSVTLTVNAAAGTLEVSPATGLSMTGDVGGPFSPPSQNYTLTNAGGTTITYTVSNVKNWVSLSSTGGSLEPELSTDVLVAINSNAVSLAAGPHSDTVNFTNTTNGNDNTSRSVELTVNAVEPPPPPPDEVSITVETGICTVERFPWGTIISRTVETSGSVSGPVGTDFSVFGLSDVSCSAWSNCERSGVEPSTTGWTASGFRPGGDNEITFQANSDIGGSKTVTVIVTCPLNWTAQHCPEISP